MKTIGLIGGMSWESSLEYYRIIIENLSKKGAEAVILGCTEIPLLIKQEDVTIPLFDTTRIHAESAVDYALGNNDIVNSILNDL